MGSAGEETRRRLGRRPPAAGAPAAGTPAAGTPAAGTPAASTLPALLTLAVSLALLAGALQLRLHTRFELLLPGIAGSDLTLDIDRDGLRLRAPELHLRPLPARLQAALASGAPVIE